MQIQMIIAMMVARGLTGEERLKMTVMIKRNLQSINKRDSLKLSKKNGKRKKN